LSQIKYVVRTRSIPPFLHVASLGYDIHWRQKAVHHRDESITDLWLAASYAIKLQGQTGESNVSRDIMRMI